MLLQKSGQKSSMARWGGGVLLVSLGLGAAALLVRTAGGLGSLLKRTKGVHLDVHVQADEEK